MFFIGLFTGMALGALCGVAILGCCKAASEADRRMEQYLNDKDSNE